MMIPKILPKKQFILPGVNSNTFMNKINMILYDLMNQAPSFFKEDVRVIGLHGNYYGTKWSLESLEKYPNVYERARLPQIIYDAKNFNEKNLMVWIDASNPFISEQQRILYYDGAIVDIYKQYSQNAFIVTNHIAYDEIKKYGVKNFVLSPYVEYYPGRAQYLFDSINHHNQMVDKDNETLTKYQIIPQKRLECTADSETIKTIICNHYCFNCNNFNEDTLYTGTYNLQYKPEQECFGAPVQDSFYSRSNCNIKDKIIYDLIQNNEILTEQDVNELQNIYNHNTFIIINKGFFNISSYLDLILYYLAKEEHRSAIKSTIYQALEKVQV